MVDTTPGWDEIVNGHLIQGVWKMYDTSFAGYTFIILLVLFQMMLYLKTKSMSLLLTTGIIAIGTVRALEVYYSLILIPSTTYYIVSTIMIFEFGVWLYQVIWQ